MFALQDTSTRFHAKVVAQLHSHHTCQAPAQAACLADAAVGAVATTSRSPPVTQVARGGGSRLRVLMPAAFRITTGGRLLLVQTSCFQFAGSKGADCLAVHEPTALHRALASRRSPSPA